MTTFTKMIDGYRRFRETGYAAQHQRWEELSKGQSPKVMVIACSDSRVDPAQIFDASPGEIFVVRNVANLVPPYQESTGHHGVSAAVEFAVTQLKIPEIVVIGHGNCSGIHACLSHQFEGAANGSGGFIDKWIGLLSEARERVVAVHGDGPEAVHQLELESVRVSLANLRTFPFVKDSEAKGVLKLHGAYFTIANGILHVMDKQGAFRPV